jgi:molybdopterin synthase sulfur carrier subunit
MKLTVLYFASLRESLGLDRESLELPAGVHTVGDLRQWLRMRGGAWETALAEGRAVRAAVAQRMAEPDTVLTPGAEVAFFPPVTGG